MCRLTHCASRAGKNHLFLVQEAQMSRTTNSVASLLVAGVTLTMFGTAQDFNIPQVPPETHLLDPLLGQWTYIEDLHNPRYGKAKGTWTFNRSADGFVVFDEFRTANGAGGTAVLAETYRAFNPESKTWSFQATIYQAPMIGRRNGEWDAGVTRIYDGQIFDEVTKGNTITRARFYNITKDAFSCVFETSKDGGKTWVSPVDIQAVRTAISDPTGYQKQF